MSVRRPVLILTVVAALTASTTPSALAAPGDLDQSFATAGIHLFDPDEAGYDLPSKVVTPKRAVVVAGMKNGGFVLSGFTRNGRLDGSFGDQGNAIVSADPAYDTTYGVVRLRSGKLLAAFLVRPRDDVPFGEAPLLLARFGANGARDRSFGADGVVDTGLRGSIISRGVDVARAPDGEIVILTGAPDSFGFQVARFHADGALDRGFGEDGSEILFPGQGWPEAGVAVARDGRIVVAGTAGNQAYVLRLLETGAPDPSFGDEGIAVAPTPNDYYVTANDVALGARGRIVLAGIAQFSAFLTVFDAGGDVERHWTDDPPASSSFDAVTIGRDGGIFAVGAFGFQAGVGAFQPDGTPWTSFGTGGRVMTPFRSDGGEWTAVAAQPNGKLVTAGAQITDFGRGGAEYLPAVARYKVGGSHRDADADGIRDSRDRCPSLAARRHRGCPAYRVSLTLHRSRHGFTGRARSATKQCGRVVDVRVVRARPGRDRKVAVDRHPRHGRFSVAARKRAGRYYAAAGRTRAAGTGICKAARSRTLTLSR